MNINSLGAIFQMSLNQYYSCLVNVRLLGIQVIRITFKKQYLDKTSYSRISMLNNRFYVKIHFKGSFHFKFWCTKNISFCSQTRAKNRKND